MHLSTEITSVMDVYLLQDLVKLRLIPNMSILCPYWESVVVLLNLVINKHRKHFEAMHEIAIENMFYQLFKTFHFSTLKVILQYLIRI